MKLRTSFFNTAVLRKDITRFAPAWVLYTLGLGLCAFLMSGSSRDWLASNVAETLPGLAVVNLLYAFLNVQLLFGDLFNNRMCNALHAMPMRREGWFLTHVTAGVAFSLIPTVFVALLLMLPLGDMCYISLLVVLGSFLQYLFFFGLALFSCLCAGNRFAMGLIYGILNFLSLLVYWLADTLYKPMLYGVVITPEPFQQFSPVVQMSGFEYLLTRFTEMGLRFRGLETAAWVYLLVCALIGIGLGALALVLYRKRQLEVAGDFIALKILEPVFLVAYSITLGGLMHMFYYASEGDNMLLFLFIGVEIGWFTGRMLLMRTLKVFQKKTFLGLAAVMGALLLSLGLTALDMGGVEQWIPSADQVASVTVTPSRYGRLDACTTADPHQISQVLQIHQSILEEYEESGGRQSIDGRRGYVTLTYKMKSGVTRQRQYSLTVDSEARVLLRKLLSSPKVLFDYEDYGQFLDNIGCVEFNGNAFYSHTIYASYVRALSEALWQDAEDGNLCQEWALLPDSSKTDVNEWVHIYWKNGSSLEIMITGHAGHTLSWLKENGLYKDIE